MLTIFNACPAAWYNVLVIENYKIFDGCICYDKLYTLYEIILIRVTTMSAYKYYRTFGYLVQID